MKILIQKLARFAQLVLNIVIFAVIGCLVLFSFIQHSEAAIVAPNGQSGRCGPYYLWYQTGPDRCIPSVDYVDLCDITLDISDIVDDFDFVYFTDTANLKRALLDRNRDGISDQYFFGISENQIEWKPDRGCVRIPQKGCCGSTFNEKCGYAMISIQPKFGFRNGSATIPVKVTKKCPPNGVDCSETFTIFHEYANCYTISLPDFIVQKQVDPVFTTYNQDIKYTIVVQNTGEEKGNTILTDTITSGTNGGILALSEIKITCPPGATCAILSITNEEIRISLTDIPGNDKVTITYTRKIEDIREIPKDEASYFTNTATLLNGSSAQATMGIKGSGDFPPWRRPERPRKRER